MKYGLLAGAAFFVLSSVFVLCLGKISARAEQRYTLMMLRRKQYDAPQYTIIWHRTDTVLSAYTGTVTDLDDLHIVVEGARGPVVVDRRLIVEAL